MIRSLLTCAMLLAILMPATVWAAPIVVQSKICTDGPTASSTFTCTFDSTTTGGNSIVVGAAGQVGTVTNITVTDNKSGTYVQKVLTTGSVSDSMAAVGTVGTPGTTTLTATYTNSVQPTYHGICMMEVSGVDGTNTDGFAGNNQAAPGTGADAVTSTAIVPTINNELLVGGHWNTSNVTGVFTAGTGWTQQQNKNTGTSMIGMCQTLQQTTAGSQASTATMSISQEAKSWIIALKTAVPAALLQSPSLPMGALQ